MFNLPFMKALLLAIFFTAFSYLCFAQQSYAPVALLPAKNLAIFGRGLYPGDDSTFRLLKHSGFNTLLLSSFYIHADGDLYSGDSHQPIIHNGKWVGDSSYVRRVTDLKRKSSISGSKFCWRDAGMGSRRTPMILSATGMIQRRPCPVL
jgi:hypothetical protein